MTSQQQPLHSGFGAQTTAREVVAGRDLSGALAIVTGGAGGCGLATTRALAEAGATVIAAVRSPDKAREALHGIPRVEVAPLDLADPASIDAFARAFIASSRPLTMLVNNAGIMAVPLARDARGYESQLATNHLGHFQLTLRLWPALRAAAGARVVALSSRGHARAGGAFDFADPMFERTPYDKWVAYYRSKTANVLFALALDARGQRHGVRAFSVHPGAVNSDLSRHVSAEELAPMRARFSSFKTIEQGAATSVWCATSPALAGIGGVYCEDVDVARVQDEEQNGVAGVRPYAVDRDAAERLWQLSEQWTGVAFE